MNMGVYSITNKIDGKRYIGSSINLKKRINKHKLDLNKNKHCSLHLQNSWNKYGSQNFEFEILEFVEKEKEDELIKREQFFIDTYKSNEHLFGYNIRKFASSNLKIEVSEKTRQKLREANTGKKHSDETKQKISVANKGKTSPFFDKKHSEESREKISKNHANFSGENNPNFGKHFNEEIREKISESHKGKVHSEETKQKMSNAHLGKPGPNLGKHFSEETKQRLSVAISGENHPMAKFNWENINIIREKYFLGASKKELAIEFNTTVKYIYKIVNNKVWKK
jgi:predicted GIY-YIG superfamily endonuclease